MINQHGGKFAFLVIVGVLVVVYFAVQYFVPQVRTEQRVEHHARLLCHPPKDGFRKGMDGWDKPMKYHTVEIEDPYATKCTVTSAGRDGEFDTDDDISAVDHDYHKTKIVTEWAGSKIKEGVKGLWKGFKDSE